MNDPLNESYRQLGWVFLGFLAWLAVRSFSERAAGYMLAALVIGALVNVSPMIAKVGTK